MGELSLDAVNCLVKKEKKHLKVGKLILPQFPGSRKRCLFCGSHYLYFSLKTETKSSLKRLTYFFFI